MPIYCDESGGVGRGVMTVAALVIEKLEADDIVARFRETIGWRGEIKGSRIDLRERALLFELLEESQARVCVTVAISATHPFPGEDRGDHDIETYVRLMEAAVSAALPADDAGAQVIMDDGRYGDATLQLVRTDIVKLLGPGGSASMELSHRLAGLQLADVIANSFFNRALVSPPQSRLAAIVAPMMESGRIHMQVVAPATH